MTFNRESRAVFFFRKMISTLLLFMNILKKIKNEKFDFWNINIDTDMFQLDI